jgi:hypothetical protein
MKKENKQTMRDDRKRISMFIVSTLAVLCLVFMCTVPVAAQAGPQPQVLSNAVVNQPLQFDISPPLRDLAAKAPAPQGVRVIRPHLQPKLDKLKAAVQQGEPAGGSALAPSAGAPLSATIGLNFDGIGQNATNSCPNATGFFTAPPDTNAAVGDTQVVQWVNVCYAVFDKATGKRIQQPFAGNAFWSGFGGPCEAANDSDPIIQFDKVNHRWVAVQNTFFHGFNTCIAVSQTADATGRFFRFAFPQPGFPDFPKWGLTPDVYYQTQNDFGDTSRFLGVNVCAYEAGLLLKGNPKARQICILDNGNDTLFDDSLLPADSDSTLDAKGSPAPEVLLGSIDNFAAGNSVFEYVFTVNFKHNGTATLAGVQGTMPITVPTYSLACGGGTCIPQPSPGSDLLDSLGDRLSYRLARFDDGTTQHFVVNHSVNNTTAVGVRWYDFTAPSGSTTLTLADSGDTPDDGEFRWLGSAAMDRTGDIALGYSRSSAAAGDFPSIYVTGRVPSDPAGTLESETLIQQGGGSQFFTDGRWGDYSSMALDTADGCTFWYTSEYYPADAVFAWNTRLASLKFPTCP